MRASTRVWERAVHSLGIEPSPRIRPDPVRWLWYAWWGPLPDRYRLWVLYDATCSTWVLRYFAHVLAVVTVPSVLVALLLPGSLGVLTAVLTGLLAFLLTAVWVNEGTEHRLVQAGWRWDTGPAVRRRRSDLAQRMS
jgi:hypothetical protein